MACGNKYSRISRTGEADNAGTISVKAKRARDPPAFRHLSAAAAEIRAPKPHYRRYVRVIVVIARTRSLRASAMDDGNRRRSAGRRRLYPLCGRAGLSPLDPRDKGRHRGVPSPPRRRSQNTDGMDASGVERDDLLAFEPRVLCPLSPPPPRPISIFRQEIRDAAG